MSKLLLNPTQDAEPNPCKISVMQWEEFKRLAAKFGCTVLVSTEHAMRTKRADATGEFKHLQLTCVTGEQYTTNVYYKGVRK